MTTKLANRKLALARKACEEAIALAERFNHEISVVAVDSGGRPLVLMRTDRAAYTSLEPARRKAVTAASFQFPSAVLAEMARGDPVGMRALEAGDDLLAVPGGFPLLLDGNCIGGFAIAGGHYTEDQMIGEKVVEALSGQGEQGDD